MTTTDLIFWYTGGTIWAAIGLLLALGTLLVCIAALYRVHKAISYWNAIWRLCWMGEADRRAFQAAFHNEVSDEEIAKFHRLTVKYKRWLRRVPGPTRIPLGWKGEYELTNGDHIRISSRGSDQNENTHWGFDYTPSRDYVDHRGITCLVSGSLKADGVVLGCPGLSIRRIIKPPEQDHNDD